MFALALPVLLIEIDFDAVLPTTTDPKFQEVGFRASKAEGAAAPLPVSDKFCGELEASLTTDTLPEALPVAGGAKLMVNEVEAPAATVRGSAIPLTL
jgi:hypothetical protein